jgi:hypothetical protein
VNIFSKPLPHEIRDSAVGIATGYGLDDRGVVKESFLHLVQTVTMVNTASYPMGIGGSFPKGKTTGEWSCHSPPTSAEVKKTLVYTSTPQYVLLSSIIKSLELWQNIPSYSTVTTVTNSILEITKIPYVRVKEP